MGDVRHEILPHSLQTLELTDVVEHDHGADLASAGPADPRCSRRRSGRPLWPLACYEAVLRFALPGGHDEIAQLLQFHIDNDFERTAAHGPGNIGDQSGKGSIGTLDLPRRTNTITPSCMALKTASSCCFCSVMVRM